MLTHNSMKSELLVVESHPYHPPASTAPPRLVPYKAMNAVSSHQEDLARDSWLGFDLVVLLEYSQPSASSGSPIGTQARLSPLP